jgi:hypothetical protein
MRRALYAQLTALACALAAGPVAAAATQSSSSSTPPRASLDGFVCKRASDALDRVIAVVGVMRPVTGTQRLEMRFVLQQRTNGATSFTAVHGGDLGRWREPSPVTLGQNANDVWRLRKLVANLPGPATYRFRVSFRWLGASSVLSYTTLVSNTCTEPQ